MFEFANPGFLAAGAALVSAPIIIHLINRMRYKRIRWAAMEFLLKSQKKNRRRLIIEQMILLLLRCLLIVMALWLVARLTRFFDFTLGTSEKQKALHVVILDDSLSMRDHVQDGKRANLKTCFDVARSVVLDEIAKNAKDSTTPQDMQLIVLSQLASKKDYKPAVFQDLRNEKTLDRLKAELASLKCSMLHVPLKDAVVRAAAVAEDNKDDQVIVHVVSDFRHQDWGTREAEALCKVVLGLALLKDESDKDRYRVNVNLIDCAHPYRTEAKDAPAAHENVGISEFYPEARVVARGSYVRFWLTIYNFSSTSKDVRISLFDPESGTPLLQFETGQVISVPPGKKETKIDAMFHRDTEGYAQIAAKLNVFQGNNQIRDGLPPDDVRYTAVFVRPKIPVLIVDGDPRRGNKDGGDTHHLAEALDSAPGSGYEIVRAGVEGLDEPNLDRYPSIYLLNVPSLSPTQQKNLEAYVRDGGSVAFFLGKDVDAQFYNTSLYNQGKGLFPVELADQYFPPRDKPALLPNLDDNHFKVLLRLEKFPSKEKFPIFGPMFESKDMVNSFKFLPIRRYWKIRDLQNWRPQTGVTDELATMPNEDGVGTYAANAQSIRRKLAELADDRRFEKYSAALTSYGTMINKALEKDKKGNDKKLYELADALDKLLNDRGDDEAAAKGAPSPTGKPRPERANMTKFWDLPGNENLRNEISELLKTVRYGHPLVLASRFGRGRVVTVMTTAGKEWNDWAGGAEPASFSYPPMILEMQSYLTSLGSEANLTVGTRLRLDLDGSQFAPKVNRVYFRPHIDEGGDPARGAAAGRSLAAEKKEGTEYMARDAKTGRQVYVIDNCLEPGFYRFDLSLLGGKAERSGGVEQRGYAFNVDTMREGDLHRVSREKLMDSKLKGAPSENLKLRAPFGWGEALRDRRSDFSESPWFYLIFLIILVSEQALAVHLSFHLRDADATLPAQAVKSQALGA